MINNVLVATVALGAMVLTASPALAVNNGFESGDTTGWTSSDPLLTGAATALGSFNPQEGAFFGYATAGAQDVFTTLSQQFVLTAGQKLSGFVGFRANDVYEDNSIIYNDSAYLKINGITVFFADVQAVGDFGSSPWTAFSITSPSGGNYVLELGVANHGDSEPSFASSAVLDAVQVANVPEPGAWAMMLIGFAGIGVSVRRRRHTVAC